jgi:hypothetical protein
MSSTMTALEKSRAMKREYDFSKASGASFTIEDRLGAPAHLDPNVAEWLTSHAEAKGTMLNELVNELLKKDIIEAAK